MIARVLTVTVSVEHATEMHELLREQLADAALV